jgi:hypothetical protein
MTREEELQVAQDIAGARLEMVEEFRWPICLFLGYAIHCKWGEMWLSILIPVVVFFVIVIPWDRAYEAARDAYARETKTGRYWIPPAQKGQ